jgi:hypothetical protein
MSFFNHYMATYSAYISSPELYVFAIPAVILWVYLFSNGKYAQSIGLSFISSAFATVLFWSKW